MKNKKLIIWIIGWIMVLALIVWWYFFFSKKNNNNDIKNKVENNKVENNNKKMPKAISDKWKKIWAKIDKKEWMLILTKESEKKLWEYAGYYIAYLN